ncbi:MAG: hypothetical protein FWH17_10580 [Oscillospiraceae bacterium]|nr:hypothetical protein [Oscillospiraceae bacterium]
MPKMKPRIPDDIDLNMLFIKYKRINKVEVDKVAADFGVSRRSVYTWIKEPAKVPHGVLMKLFRVFGVPIAEVRDNVRYQ